MTQLAVPDEAHMQRVARALAAGITAGDIVELCGSMGAGKTTFTRYLAEALGCSDVVRSPTYTVAHIYELADGATLAHIDAWRHEGIIDAAEWGDLAPVLDATIACIEWPDPLEPWLADRSRWRVELVHAGADRRLVRIAAPSGRTCAAFISALGGV